MEPQRKLIDVAFLVDTNCVNARQKIVAMNQLEELAARKIIQLLTADTAKQEMLAGSNAARTEKAYRFISTLSYNETPEENAELATIENALFPGGAKDQNQKNDVEIVFNAKKYGALITTDGGSKSQPGGILGNREKLAELGVRVFTPDEALDYVRREIASRDTYARAWADLYGRPIPEWVGND
jgi:hypothetical protein